MRSIAVFRFLAYAPIWLHRTR